MKKSWFSRLAVVIAGTGFAAGVHAQQEIKIGVLYPLTGPGAAVGAELRSALEMAVDIINNGAPGIAELP